jgi:type VI secretion system secreted protein Hcp
VDELFLKIDGIPGESSDDKHKDEIQLVAFSWGVDRAREPGRLGAGKSGRPEFRPFSFQMRVNKASPELFLACASGKHLKEALLTVRKAGGKPLEYLKIKFTDVLVTSFEQASGDEAPAETVAFDFGKIDLEHTSQDPRGGAGAVTTAGWDLAKNAKL